MKTKLFLATSLGGLLLWGATSGNIQWLQIRSVDRHGTNTYGQASDGTGTSGNFATFNASGGLTNGAVPPATQSVVPHFFVTAYNAVTGAFSTAQAAFTDITGIATVAQGGTGTASPALVAGSNVTITGSWPNQTIASSGGGAGGSGCGAAGVNAQTSSYTLVSGDSGKLVTFNGSSLTATLYASPASGYTACIENLAATVLTVSTNSLQYNGATTSITLQQYQTIRFVSNGTNYLGSVPDIAGTNVTLTQATNGQTIAASGGGGGGGGFTQIAQTVLVADTATATFSSIAGSYSSLTVTGITRSTAAAVNDLVVVQFNGDTTSAYAYQAMYAGGGTNAAFNSNSATSAVIANVNAANTRPTGGAGSFRIWIPGYATGFTKSCNALASANVGGSSMTTQTSEWSCFWSGTGAITSITLAPSTGGAKFVSGSVFTLYGLQ